MTRCERRSHRGRTATLLGASLVGALLCGLVAPASPATATATVTVTGVSTGADTSGNGEPPFTATPATGPTGTAVAVAGTDCRLPGSDEPGDGVVVTLVRRGAVEVGTTVEVGPDGTWRGSLTVPAGTPAGDYRLRAKCVAPGWDESDPVTYARRTFTVTGAGPAAPAADPSTPETPDDTAAPGTAATPGGTVAEGIATPAFNGGIESFPLFDGQSTCSPSAKPGTAAFRSMVMANYGGGDSGIVRACSVGSTSEHKEGRAWDWSMNAYDAGDRARVQDLFNWLFATDTNCNRFANARRLGLMYVIWNRQMFRMYEPARGWTAYTGPVPHTDHVHFSFTRAGGNATTSYWTRNYQAPPFRASDRVVQRVDVNASWGQPASGDFDGDGRDDLLWYDTPSGDHFWYSAGGGRFTDSTRTVARGFTPLTGDFNGDCVDDVFWYAPGDAPDSMWLGRTNRGFQVLDVTVNGSYQPFTGDFNGDRADDIFWYRPGTNRDAVWYGTVYGRFVGRSATMDGDQQPLAGDFDGDGPDDIYWYGAGTEPDLLWRGSPSGRFSVEPADSDFVSDRPMVGDYNADQRADIFWYGAGTEHDAIWLGSRSRSFIGIPTTADGTFAHAVAGDIDGNGHDDVVFHGDGRARARVWRF